MYIERGAVFRIPFDQITWLPSSIPGNGLPHRVIVYTGPHAANDSWEYVSIIPVSTLNTLALDRENTCVTLHPQAGTGIAEKCWAIVPLLQPIEKAALLEKDRRGNVLNHLGNIPAAVMRDVDLKLGLYAAMDLAP